ncbi:dihydropteroate synthase [Neisseriaceae bacterium TC5R-5]|nr:dihydropteroate synthase [Neisseriaceae bacterium TC5R-5]
MTNTVLQCGRYVLDLSEPLVMGIVNVTPDSFSDGGCFQRVDLAVQHAESLLMAGAAILDIGGESTRPRAAYVSPQEEMDRVLPVLEGLQDCGVPLSLDTRRTEVMREALRLGLVDLINDVSALEDEGAAKLLSPYACAICLMHKKGEPDNMQLSPQYQDVLSEVSTYLAARVRWCLDAGIAPQRLLIDPGFGFGKSLSHNLTLLAGLTHVQDRVQVPLLVGLSRKSMLGEITGEDVPAERLGASVAAALESVRRGAKIVRVHDVKATTQALRILAALADPAV